MMIMANKLVMMAALCKILLLLPSTCSRRKLVVATAKAAAFMLPF